MVRLVDDPPGVVRHQEDPKVLRSRVLQAGYELVATIVDADNPDFEVCYAPRQMAGLFEDFYDCVFVHRLIPVRLGPITLWRWRRAFARIDAYFMGDRQVHASVYNGEKEAAAMLQKILQERVADLGVKKVEITCWAPRR